MLVVINCLESPEGCWIVELLDLRDSKRYTRKYWGLEGPLDIGDEPPEHLPWE